VASQNVTDPSLGARALDLLALGADAEQAIAVLRGSAPHMAYRQLLVVDARGGSATHSGPSALGIWAEARAENVACGGNLLASAEVPTVMAETFRTSTGETRRPADPRDAGGASGGGRGRPPSTLPA
jgi:uncharacterized Ntn-hydrolase superfamily protein